MIGDIIRGIEKSKIVLIEDSTDNPGRCVLVCFVVSLLKRVDEVHLVSFDSRSKELQRVVPLDLKAKLIVHNGHEDLLGWKKSSSLNVHSDLIKALQEKCSNKLDRKTAVVIDSISPLLIHRPVPYTCQTIHRLGSTDKLGTDVEQVVCLVHHDLHDNSSLALVEHTASTIIKLTDSKSQQHKHCCNMLHKKISGKIHRNIENFNVTKQFDITDVTEPRTQASTLPKDSNPQTGRATVSFHEMFHFGQLWPNLLTKQKMGLFTNTFLVLVSATMTQIPNFQKVSYSQMATDPNPQIDPTADLTFNLSLTDKEKQARSQVKLPYTYNQQRQDETLTKSVGEGKIFYQPDEADDFDEEDPDDDLDI